MMFLNKIPYKLSLFIIFHNVILATSDAVSFNNYARNAQVFNEYHIPKNYSTDFNEFIIPRVVGGRVVNLGEVPYQVSFKRYWNNTYRNFCGGCILKPTKVVSAAHCFIKDGPNLFFNHIFNIRFYIRPLSQIYAHAGTIHTSWPKVEQEDSWVGGQWRSLYDCYYPRGYNFPFEDIAVVILNKPFVFGATVSAIGYAKVFDEYLKTTCVVSGFGSVNPNEASKKLMVANLRIITDYECSYLYGRKMKKFVCTTDNFTDVGNGGEGGDDEIIHIIGMLLGEVLGVTMIQDESNKKGDSGGPLVCNTGPKGAKELVGVVSGKALGRSSFFTRVAAFKSLIESPGLMLISTLTKYCIAIWLFYFIRYIFF